MKKLIYPICFFALILSIFPSGVSAGVTGQVLDQQNSTLPWVDCSQISDLNRAMIFKPAVNLITSVEIYLAARANNANITLTIMKESDSSTVGTVTQQISGAVTETWETFSFNDPFVTVVPEESYSLNLASNEDQTRVCYTGNNYSRGFYRGLPDVDWLFKIYGKNTTQAAVSTTDTNSTSSNTSNSSSSKSKVSQTPTSTPSTTTNAALTDGVTTTTANANPAPAPWYRNYWILALCGLDLLLIAFLIFLIIRRRKQTRKITA
jgi:hypothetical protein